MTTAFTTSMLAWGLLAFPTGYARAGQTHAALANVRWGADYLLKAYTPNAHPKHAGDLNIVYQV